MQRHPASTGHLDDLHKEIDYFDRKIAYCREFEKFESEMARDSALRKLITRRGTLVKAAVAMAAEGIQGNPKYLPRSFRTDTPNSEPKTSA